MNFPKHIILDVNKFNFNLSNKNWIHSFLLINGNDTVYNNYFNLFKNNCKFVNFLKKKKLFYKTFNYSKTLNHLNFDIGFKTYNLNNLFDVNFLKKEKIYTKLKYSRVPQYDIVSGGVAALFAGFIGFLVSEKFGLELADSGDFYYLFMYVVFFFSL